MRIERHVFGSFSGYTTLARSAGVSPEDGRALESAAYTFGQSHDRGYLKSLVRNPAYFTRALSGGRRGLARLLEGSPDDNNRPTLRLITVIISQRDWDTLLCGDVGLLLDDRSLWEWGGDSTLPTLEIVLSAPSRSFSRKSLDKILALVSETEKAIAGRRSLIVSTDDYSYPELRALEMLVPPAARRQFTSACRGLSNQLPVSVNALASEAGAQARAGYRYAAGENHLSPYATYLAATELSTGVIPVEAIARYQQFGILEPRTAAGAAATVPQFVPASQHVRRQGGSFWPTAIVGVLGLALATGTFLAGKSMGTGATLVTEHARQDEQRQEQEAALNTALATQATAHQEQLKKAMDVDGSSYADAVAASAAKLLDAQKAAAATAKTVATAVQDTAGDRDRYRSAYEAEFNRQRAQFEALRKEAAAALAVDDIRKMAQAAQTLQKIEGQLATLADEWPATTDENRKWIAELRTTRGQVHDAVLVASSLGRICVLLESCEDTLRVADGKSALNLAADVEEALDLVGQLPGKRPTMGVDMGKFKLSALGRAERIKHWLSDQEKLAAKPGPGPHEIEFWRNLAQEERRRIRDKYYHDHPQAPRDKDKDWPESEGTSTPAPSGSN